MVKTSANMIKYVINAFYAKEVVFVNIKRENHIVKNAVGLLYVNLRGVIHMV